jgi:hypothetical protein
LRASSEDSTPMFVVLCLHKRLSVTWAGRKDLCHLKLYIWSFTILNQNGTLFKFSVCSLRLARRSELPCNPSFPFTPGADFSYIFSAENHFPRKIPRNFLEKRLIKSFSPTFSGGKFSAEFSPKFSSGKNVLKIGPSWKIVIKACSCLKKKKYW